MKTKSIAKQPRKNTKQNRRLRRVYLVLSVVVLVALVTTGFALMKKPKPVSTPAANPHLAVLHIESSVAGISMQGAPYCGSGQLKKQTPYDCVLPQGKTQSVISAPPEVVNDGKVYVFQSWDGCSEGNTDQKICRADTALGTTKTLKASYTLKGQAPSSTSSTKNQKYDPNAPEPEHDTANARSAPGCQAPDPSMEQYPFSQTYGDVVYCLLDTAVPAGSIIYLADNVSEPLYPANSYVDVNALSAYASCYTSNRLDAKGACVRNPARPSDATPSYPLGFQSILANPFSPVNSDGLKILKVTDVVISTAYSTSTMGCGVGCIPTGTIYHLDRWQIDKTVNSDGTNYYKVTTYRKYITTLPNFYNSL